MFKPNVVKCPYCEGRTNNSRKTLYLYPDTHTYFCFRCKAFGNIENLDNVELQLERKDENVHRLLSSWNGRSGRRSLCNPRHRESNTDFFGIKNPSGKLVGFHERKPDKVSRTNGQRLFGFSSDFLVLGETYRLVEGPYDVVYPEDVCTFGIPGKEQARQLKYYNLILCPDGDVWETRKTLVQWLKPFLYSKVLYVERLPNDKDPDEIAKVDRNIIEWKDLRNWIFKQKEN